MFSGIRSFFGYASTDEISEASSQQDQQEASFSVVEQTLSDAAAKFTEQILLPSPSIEQLQSSSRQLLPTLKEQHEEDELKKKKKQDDIGLNDQKLKETDDDDEGFNADTWELLDYGDKPELGETSGGQGSAIDSKVAVGILKQASQTNATGQRQKARVSFGTPTKSALVKGSDDQQKIEQQANEENKSGNILIAKAKKNRKKNKTPQQPNPLPKEGGDAQETNETYPELPKSVAQKQTKPILNYAAAAKSNADVSFISKKETEVKSEDLQKIASLTRQQVTRNNPQVLGPISRPIKRNRPVSSSSWSSNDEVEAVNQNILFSQASDLEGSQNITDLNESSNSFWDDDGAEPPLGSIQDEREEESFNSDDSDFEYSYGRYIKPTKKSSSSSTSNLLLRANRKARPRSITVKSQLASLDMIKSTSGPLKGQRASTSFSTSLVGPTSSTEKGLTKPKKKKIVLVAQPSSSSPKASKSINLDQEVSKSESQKSSHASPVKTLTQTPASEQASSSPKQSASLSASTGSGNDSSDIAEMDESWFVTPPPCFTGASKSVPSADVAPKAAARENALIEHPSIYISSSSRIVEITEVSPPSNGRNLDEAKQSKNLLESKNTAASIGKNQQSKPSSSIQKSLGSKNHPQVKGSDESKARWTNRFIVDDWDNDAPEDLSDFDSMFESQCIAPKANKVTKTTTKPVAKPVSRKPCRERNPSPDEWKLEDEDDSDVDSWIEGSPPALVGLTDKSSSTCSFEIEKYIVEARDENLELSSQSMNENMMPKEPELDDSPLQPKEMVSKRPPTQVRPIEAERKPGWQLRRKRARRRPLTGGCSSGGSSPKSKPQLLTKSQSAASPLSELINSPSADLRQQQRQARDASASELRSLSSSPSLIDRIGSSIVANLSQLTGTFQSANTLPSLQTNRAAIEESTRVQQAAAWRALSDSKLATQKCLTKGYMKRQNDCVKVASSRRRADRREKMYSTPNGCSVNRKVQSNFH